MTFHYFVVLSLLCSLMTVNSQCISANDIAVNETNIGAATRNLLDGSAHFSFDLFRTLQTDNAVDKHPSGMFFSPFSIWSSLIVTYMGAKGVTENEMRSVLGIHNLDKFTTWGAFKSIQSFDQYRPESGSLSSANRVYFQENTRFKDCIEEMIRSEIAFVDFENNPEAAREAINAWVEKETNDKIKDLIPSNGISSLTKMIIANAIYFKESWLQPFNELKTARRRFTTAERKEIFVNMMQTRGRFLYGKSEELNCYALDLPYTGNTLSMTILLPKNRYRGVRDLAYNLTPNRLRNLLADMYPREVVAYVPKFKVEDTFELSSVLNKMGLRSLFDPRRVDLSGFTGLREFTVDSVLHKAFVNVDEKGTEAAAATAVITSRSARPLGPATFNADYPFVFFIRDSISNVILFIGTVQNPPEVDKE
ncbi:leukocyte elastase inhibitor-like [Uloborus diversus]|uniref:leukocyte elastase inhibitor-like n=1 Tax=Uloborus diversus TaxID=327109 RepID=UPI00240A446A|nr:leukocyte elastase inhibitor-like [Uloborus diversus]